MSVPDFVSTAIQEANRKCGNTDSDTPLGGGMATSKIRQNAEMGEAEEKLQNRKIELMEEAMWLAGLWGVAVIILLLAILFK